MYDDDWYDPLDDLPPKEEPDCPPCGDSGSIPPAWLGRLFRRTSLGCPSCNPDRVQRLYQWSRLYVVRGWLWRLRHRPQVVDDAPF
jgi:hypothetical protein